MHCPTTFTFLLILILIIIAVNIPGFANGLARFGLGKERRVQIFQFLALCQEQPLSTFLQSTVKQNSTST